MKTLAKYHACKHCVIDEKLPGLSRNGPQASEIHTRFQTWLLKVEFVFVVSLSFALVPKSRIGKIHPKIQLK